MSHQLSGAICKGDTCGRCVLTSIPQQNIGGGSGRHTCVAQHGTSPCLVFLITMSINMLAGRYQTTLSVRHASTFSNGRGSAPTSRARGGAQYSSGALFSTLSPPYENNPATVLPLDSPSSSAIRGLESGLSRTFDANERLTTTTGGGGREISQVFGAGGRNHQHRGRPQLTWLEHRPGSRRRD